MSLFRWIEAKIPSHYYANNAIAYQRDSAPSQADVKQFLSEHGFRLESVSYRIPETSNLFEYRMTIRTSDLGNLTRLAEHLSKQANVKHFEISLTGE